MTTTAQHTPIPWRLKILRDTAGQECIIDDADGNAVAVTGVGTLSIAADHANGHMIVRAVNAHEQLVAACKGLLDWATQMGGWDAPAWDQARTAIDDATAWAKTCCHGPAEATPMHRCRQCGAGFDPADRFRFVCNDCLDGQPVSVSGNLLEPLAPADAG